MVFAERTELVCHRAPELANGRAVERCHLGFCRCRRAYCRVDTVGRRARIARKSGGKCRRIVVGRRGAGLVLGARGGIVRKGFLRTVLSLRTHLHRGRRQAVFVVASAVLQIALHLILLVGQLNALGKLGRAFEKGHGHVENRVLLVLQSRTGAESALEFGAFEHIGAESGRRGTAGRDARAVDVPTGRDATGEHHVNLRGADAFGGDTERDLRLHGHHAQQHKGEEEK